MAGEVARPAGIGNTMTFPRALRDAIPDLPTCVGRVLALTATDGRIVSIPFGGDRVRLRLTVAETGKLSGEFAVLVDLLPEAARELARTLDQLAGDLGQS